MSLFESGDSTGDISLEQLCNNKLQEKLTGEANYSFNDAEMTITQITSTTIVGSNYSKYEDIDPYLKREGFTEIG